jgi:hypothetical protein
MMDTISGLLQDHTLRHLPLALDTAAMQAVFQESLFEPRKGQRFHVRACHIERVRYKPGRNCLICYRLHIEDLARQAISEQLLSARLYEVGGSHSRFARAQRETLSPSLFGRPLIHIPGLDMVVWAFPNDRKLKGLSRLTDTVYLRTVLLPPLVACHVGPHWGIGTVAHDLVHYNPEHTCMLRVQLQLEHNQTGEQRSLVLYGKAYEGDEGVETYRLMRQLWQRVGACDLQPGCHLRVAQLLGYQPELKVLWQRGLPGQTLLALEQARQDFLTWLERGAAAVATLHQTHLPCSRSSPTSAWVAKLEEMREWLPVVRPSCRTALEPLVDRLLAQAACLGEQPLATLHGDLHLQNFFRDGDQVALIDLDNVYLGSPWQDVGSFIAGLLYRGLLAETPGPLLRDMIAAFSRSYQRNVPWRIAPWALNWFVAAALINERAFRCVTRLKDGRLDLVDELVALAAQISEAKA